jgi:uncharacterized protein YuzE
MTTEIDYEEDLDLLYISNNSNKEKVFGTLVFGNLVFDVGTDGKILGAEIDCASKLFNLSQEQLIALRNAKILINTVNNMLTLGVFVEVNSIERTYQYVISNKKISLTC